MGKPEKISVQLGEEFTESVQKAIESGDFPSADAVVAQAMRLWNRQREQDLAKLRAMIDEGLKGPFEPWEGAEALIAEAKARRAARGG